MEQKTLLKLYNVKAKENLSMDRLSWIKDNIYKVEETHNEFRMESEETFIHWVLSSKEAIMENFEIIGMQMEIK